MLLDPPSAKLLIIHFKAHAAQDLSGDLAMPGALQQVIELMNPLGERPFEQQRLNPFCSFAFNALKI